MADYLYVFRGGQPMGTPEQMQANMQKWRGWIESLAKSGNFKSGEPLDRDGKVVRGKSKVVTDGPYAEAKDVIGGYLLVTAGSLDAAVELSRGCPIFETDSGTVEVRPIAKM
jgi:hypothetical protein